MRVAVVEDRYATGEPLTESLENVRDTMMQTARSCCLVPEQGSIQSLFSSVSSRQIHTRSPITLPIALDKMVFDSQRLIERFFARAQARWDTLNHSVERAVVEKGTAVPVFAAQGADDSMHG